MIWSIAWRNVWRNKKRSIVILAAVAFGLWAGLLSSALTYGMSEQMVETAIALSTSHVQIHARDFRNHREIGKFISGGKSVLEDVQNVADVRAAAGRSVIGGMASTAAAASGVQIMGVDPSAETAITEVHKRIIKGDYFKAKTRYPIVIGQKLADKLHVEPGDKIVLTAQALDGSIAGGAFRVVGIFKTASSQFDGTTVFALHDDVDASFDLNGAIHEIAILAANTDKIEAVSRMLGMRYPNLEVATWWQIEPEMGMMAGMTEQWILIFLVIILLALVFGITNTMLMSVLERVRELGVLVAMGMSHARIFAMILLETIFLSALGGAIGTVIGAGTIAVLGRTGIRLSMVEAGLAAFGASSTLYPSLPPGEYLQIAALVIVSALVASIYPGIRAVRLSPVTAIRTY